MKEGLIEQLKSARQFFLNTISCLSEEDSNFAPNEEMYTVAQQIGHSAHTVEWFIDGAFVSNGFDMNFDDYIERMKKYQSLKQAVDEFNQAVDKAIEIIGNSTDEDLVSPLPPGPIMGGAPKMAVIGGIADHTAHHRGALSVYARLIGKVPQMPYGEM
jgi:uncharacterized damage-inducible protein DinB